MTIKKLEELLNEGEGYTIEFKKSEDSLSNSVFETVSSFSNRYGGYILLGVKEVKRGNKKVGEVLHLRTWWQIFLIESRLRILSAKFFVNIGYADSLGSGVRNLYKYTKIYSNAEPDLEEDDVFRLIVPMRPTGATLTSDEKSNSVADVTEKVTDVTEKKIIELLKDNPQYKTVELAERLDISRKTVSIKLENLREKGIIERVGSDRKGYWNVYV